MHGDKARDVTCTRHAVEVVPKPRTTHVRHWYRMKGEVFILLTGALLLRVSITHATRLLPMGVVFESINQYFILYLSTKPATCLLPMGVVVESINQCFILYLFTSR